MVVEYIAIAIAATAVGYSVWSHYNPKKIEEKGFHQESMKLLFHMFGSKEILRAKQNVSFWYWQCIKSQKPIYFFNSPVESESYTLKQAFNQACTLYKFEMIPQEHFREVYGGSVVRFYKMLKEDIDNQQKSNPDICKFFKEIAESLENDYNIKGEPYETSPQQYVPDEDTTKTAKQ